MKKFFSGIVVCLMVLGFTISTSFACMGCPPSTYLQKADTQGEVYSPVLDLSDTSYNGDEFTGNWGQTYHSAHVWAGGNKSAYATYEGFSKVDHKEDYFQKDITSGHLAGGELSGSYSKTTGYTEVSGYGHGKDMYGYANPDYAGMDLEIGGSVWQKNGAYSDDRDSFAGGSNQSSVEWKAFDNDFSNGHHGDAFVSGKMKSGGEAEGYTKAYARQTDHSAFVSSETGNSGDVWVCGAEKFESTVKGSGGVYGTAKFESGSAGYNANFEYGGGNKSNGFAKGDATQTMNSSFASSFTKTNSTFNGQPRCSTDVFGSGNAAGGAYLNNRGYSEYTASYGYNGSNLTSGMAGGSAMVRNVGNFGVKSTGTAYASVSN